MKPIRKIHGNNQDKMKSYILFMIILFTNTVSAQQENLMIKPTSGRFTQGSTAGIYIYDDGTFALFGYATLVMGNYTIKDNEIHFTSDIPKQAFAVLGRENKAIKKGIKLTLASGFINDGPTYVKFDEDHLMRVFGKNFPSGKPYYTTILARHPKTISLSQDAASSLHQYNTASFQIAGNCNDFLLFYNKENSAQQPFTARFETENGKLILQSRWGKFEKQTGQKDEEWEAFLAKNKKLAEQNKKATVFYFNDKLKSATGFDHLSEQAPVFNINNYVLDQASNKFIRKDFYKKGKNYLNAQVTDYHDERYILEYKKIPVSKESSTDFNKQKIGQQALFTYKEQAFKKLVGKSSDEDPVTTEKPYPEKMEPVKIDTVKIRKN